MIHYFDSDANGDSCIATKPTTGKEYSCVITGENHWLGFPHLYYYGNPKVPVRFLTDALEYKKERGKENCRFQENY